MDDIVRAALRKWPNVPACHGWLALDARGDWYMRDDRVQRAGPFPQVKGSRIDHDKLKAFIGRNYGSDEVGSWFFQNGPQRVYVDLEVAPWTWRLSRGRGGSAGVPDSPAGPDSEAGSPVLGAAQAAAGFSLRSHTDLDTVAEASFVDEHGRLFLSTPLGLGVVHSLDMHEAADAVEQGWIQPEAVRFGDLPNRFGYRLTPPR